MCRAVLAGPLTRRCPLASAARMLWKVVCRGVALRSGSRTHPLPRAAPGRAGRRTGRTRSPLGSRPDGPRRREPEWCSRVALAPVMAALGHLAQTLEQAAQPRRRHWPVCCSAFQCAGTSVRLSKTSAAPSASSNPKILGLPVVRSQRQPERSEISGTRARKDDANGIRTSPPAQARYPCTAWIPPPQPPAGQASDEKHASAGTTPPASPPARVRPAGTTRSDQSSQVSP